MKFKFSLKISLFCGILALLMLRASYWQYQRYLNKLVYIEELDQRLKLPIEPLNKLLAGSPEPQSVLHRRVSLKGIWDYENEIILRNRKHEDVAGVHVITPLKIESESNQTWILVSRGFLPLSASSPEKRNSFRNAPSETFLALIKESSAPKLFAPKDLKTGSDLPRLDAWLRVDIPAISKQLPYPILPFYLELMSRESSEVNSNQFLVQKSERDQILFLPGAAANLNSVKRDTKDENYPIPVFDTVVPAGRHYSYIFEWGIMAFMVLLTGVMLQCRPTRDLSGT